MITTTQLKSSLRFDTSLGPITSLTDANTDGTDLTTTEGKVVDAAPPPAGAIVGGVVGGLIVVLSLLILLIIVAMVVILNRHKVYSCSYKFRRKYH